MFRNATILALAAVGVAWSGDPPSLVVQDVSGEANDFITVRAKTDGKVVRWRKVTPGLRVMPSELMRDPRAIVVMASKPGVYKLHAVTAVGDEPSEIVEVRITVRPEGSDPDPVPPAPVPPIPPGPVPPAPPDDLDAKIRALFPKVPTAADKAAALKLQAIYLELRDAVRDKSFPTVGSFLTAYRAVAEKMVRGDVILACREAARDAVFASFPTDTEAALDAATRDKAAALFDRLAVTFGSLK